MTLFKDKSFFSIDGLLCILIDQNGPPSFTTYLILFTYEPLHLLQINEIQTLTTTSAIEKGRVRIERREEFVSCRFDFAEQKLELTIGAGSPSFLKAHFLSQRGYTFRLMSTSTLERCSSLEDLSVTLCVSSSRMVFITSIFFQTKLVSASSRLLVFSTQLVISSCEIQFGFSVLQG